MRFLKSSISTILQICGVLAVLETLLNRAESFVVRLARVIRNIDGSEDVNAAYDIIVQRLSDVSVLAWLFAGLICLIACGLVWVLYARPRLAERQNFKSAVTKKLPTTKKSPSKRR